jgi:AcrR family transcriptional regulator
VIETTHSKRVPPADKFAGRRDELAQAALKTLSERGYARTSLRDIAQNSEFSHGVLHYYFDDKIDLITYCVRQYKRACMTRYDAVVSVADTPADLQRGFARVMAQTLRQDGHLHRLWYDMRSQSLFEPLLLDDVVMLDRALEGMIWRVVNRFAELSGRALWVSSSVAYGLFDGLFQRALLLRSAGDERAVEDLESLVYDVLERMVT